MYSIVFFMYPSLWTTPFCHLQHSFTSFCYSYIPFCSLCFDSSPQALPSTSTRWTFHFVPTFVHSDSPFLAVIITKMKYLSYCYNPLGSENTFSSFSRVFSEARRLPFPSVFGCWYGILSIYIYLCLYRPDAQSTDQTLNLSPRRDLRLRSLKQATLKR